MTPVVEARDLRKRYGDLEAVRGVSFSIRPGECYGFLGPNGAGKTTTMKMIYCRIAATSGALTVLGRPADPSARAVKQQLGIVGQETALDPELNVFENLSQYALYFGLGLAAARVRAREVLDFVQLAGKDAAKVSELSGGMKRRLMLARALVNRPTVLVLDEPTTGLDPQARLSVWDRLHSLRQDGVTLLITTHYMEEAARLCDRLAILHQGRVLAEGAPAALVRSHVESQVLELPADSAAAGRAGAGLSGLATRIERRGGTLYCYGPDARAALRRLEEEGEVPDTHLARPANLEDLFLKLTGAALAE